MIPPFPTGEAKAERCFSSPYFQKSACTFGDLEVWMLKNEIAKAAKGSHTKQQWLL